MRNPGEDITQVESNAGASDERQPLVSVRMITYNHAPFIAQAIGGVLMQRTDFPFELVIGEDCSTDGTREIVFDYQRRFPEIIRVITSEQNVGMRQNGIRTRAACRGKYLASCEGDDYWIDPYKLSKQVAFLERHPDYSACSHYTLVYHQERKEFLFDHRRPKALDYTQRDFVMGRKFSVRTCSILARRDCLPDGLPEDLMSASAGDNFTRILLTENHRFHVLPEYMACYRIHSGGVWSLKSREVIWKRKSHDLSLLAARYGSKYPDAVRYRIDVHDFLNADLIAREQGLTAGVLSVLRIFRHPKYACQHPLKVLVKLAKILIVGITRRRNSLK